MATKIIIVGRETVASSLTKDAGTFAVFAGLTSLGDWMESSAMQWAGFLIGAIWLLQVVAGGVRRRTFDFDGARKEIERLEMQEAGDD